MIERTISCTGYIKTIHIPLISSAAQIEDQIMKNFNLTDEKIAGIYIRSLNKFISFEQLKAPQIPNDEVLEIAIGSNSNLPRVDRNEKRPYQTFGIINKSSKGSLTDLKKKRNLLDLIPLIRDSECKRMRDNNKSFILLVVKDLDKKKPVFVDKNFLETHSTIKFAYKVDIKNQQTEIRSYYNGQSSIQTKPEVGYLTEENITNFLTSFTTRTNRFTFG